MRQKIGTSIRKPLLVQAKLTAARKNKQLNEIIEEALEKYLEAEKAGKAGSVVRAARGAIPASPQVVKHILEEPFLDS